MPLAAEPVAVEAAPAPEFVLVAEVPGATEVPDADVDDSVVELCDPVADVSDAGDVILDVAVDADCDVEDSLVSLLLVVALEDPDGAAQPLDHHA